jgi:hypothetical protein
MLLYDWLTEIDKVDDEELLLDIHTYVKARLIVVKSKNFDNEVKEIQLGEIINIGGHEIDGATLCDWCNMYFKGDGELERCNACSETTFESEKKCGLYNIHYTFDSVGIERAESFLLEHVFKVKSVDELNQYQTDVFRTIELMEVCNCMEEE